jgi:predicted amidophosphoribosyltransferase
MLFERNCPSCGQPARTICDECLGLLRVAGAVQVEGARWSKAALVYDDVAAPLILAGKNRGRKDVLRHLAQVLVPLIPDEAQVITWVPANAEARRERGYDQGKILARAVSAATGVPARQLLKRRSGPAQIGQDRAGRLAGPHLEAIGADSLRIVLLDDVMTTGASLTTATSLLRQGGAGLVWTLTISAVP